MTVFEYFSNSSLFSNAHQSKRRVREGKVSFKAQREASWSVSFPLVAASFQTPTRQKGRRRVFKKSKEGLDLRLRRRVRRLGIYRCLLPNLHQSKKEVVHVPVQARNGYIQGSGTRFKACEFSVAEASFLFFALSPRVRSGRLIQSSGRKIKVCEFFAAAASFPSPVKPRARLRDGSVWLWVWSGRFDARLTLKARSLCLFLIDA